MLFRSTVLGPTGSPQLILAHGGERLTGPNRETSITNTHNAAPLIGTMTVIADNPDAAARRLARELTFQRRFAGV